MWQFFGALNFLTLLVLIGPIAVTILLLWKNPVNFERFFCKFLGGPCAPCISSLALIGGIAYMIILGLLGCPLVNSPLPVALNNVGLLFGWLLVVALEFYILHRFCVITHVPCRDGDRDRERYNRDGGSLWYLFVVEFWDLLILMAFLAGVYSSFPVFAPFLPFMVIYKLFVIFLTLYLLWEICGKRSCRD